MWIYEQLRLISTFIYNMKIQKCSLEKTSLISTPILWKVLYVLFEDEKDFH